MKYYKKFGSRLRLVFRDVFHKDISRTIYCEGRRIGIKDSGVFCFRLSKKNLKRLVIDDWKSTWKAFNRCEWDGHREDYYSEDGYYESI